MTTSFLQVEHDYDPGFTLVVSIDRNGGTFYMRERDKRISTPMEISSYHWDVLVKGCLHGDVKGLREFMDRVASGEQVRRGWRDPEMMAKSESLWPKVV